LADGNMVAFLAHVSTLHSSPDSHHCRTYDCTHAGSCCQISQGKSGDCVWTCKKPGTQTSTL